MISSPSPGNSIWISTGGHPLSHCQLTWLKRDWPQPPLLAPGSGVRTFSKLGKGKTSPGIVLEPLKKDSLFLQELLTWQIARWVFLMAISSPVGRSPLKLMPIKGKRRSERRDFRECYFSTWIYLSLKLGYTDCLIIWIVKIPSLVKMLTVWISYFSFLFFIFCTQVLNICSISIYK